VTETETTISVLNGQVFCSNPQGELLVGPGEQAVTVAGAAPVKRILLRPLDAVQWALHYPVVLDYSDYAGFLPAATAAQRSGWEALQRGDPAAAAGAFTGGDWRDALGRSILAYQQGDLERALRELASLPEPRPADVELHAAALHLAAGQVDAASAALGRADAVIAVETEPIRDVHRSRVAAQQSIIALAQNRKDDALRLARLATAREPRAVAALLALSYAEQAHFRLEEALRAVEAATEQTPAGGAVRARLAELHLSFGRVAAAGREARRAVKEAPREARAWTVLGFVHLAMFEPDAAWAAFERALEVDDGAGLPHLGQGLALIRKGELAGGRLALERAAHLDPAVSLHRSYLGKAFFEERRENLAAAEYEIAQQLDPLDPTPHLYAAFHKLASNRPVEALADVENSIRLNDHRAVYRSRLLLDQDLAVRSVALSETFTTLGFDEAGRIEAIKSIQRDYGNWSAHGLLANLYFQIPNLQRAFLPEALIARLLAPVDLNAVSSVGGFNEFTSLFDRPRLRLTYDGEVRSGDDFVVNSLVQSGATGRWGYAVRYQDIDTGGYRGFDSAASETVNFHLRSQPTYRDTVSLETLWTHIGRGDTSTPFDPNAGNATLRLDEENLAQRIGYHRRLGPAGHLVGQLFLFDRRSLTTLNTARPFDFRLVTPGGPVPFGTGAAQADHRIDQELSGVRGDAQAIWTSSRWSFVGGGAFSEARAQARDSAGGPAVVSTPLGPGGFASASFRSAGSVPEASRALYAYSTWHAFDWLDVTLGGSYTHNELARVNLGPPFNGETRSFDHWSPKAGVTVYATPATTLRGAWFQTANAHGSTGLDRESIEPTQVAGFNQVLNDVSSADTEVFGLGLDHKLSARTYLGLEATQGVTRRPTFAATSVQTFDPVFGTLTSSVGPVVEGRTRTEVGSLGAYWHQVFNSRLAGSAQYQLLDGEFASAGGTGVLEQDFLAHRVALSLSYFHPSRWFARATTTWRDQALRGSGAPPSPEGFWITDLSVGYQFPRRHGTITVTARNLFEQDYRFLDVGLDDFLRPVRTVSLKVRLTF
jgi:tetratricopeptide (TPR) repeat protein